MTGDPADLRALARTVSDLLAGARKAADNVSGTANWLIHHSSAVEHAIDWLQREHGAKIYVVSGVTFLVMAGVTATTSAARRSEALRNWCTAAERTAAEREDGTARRARAKALAA